MSSPVSVVVFDVNQTLSDMRPMEQRFIDVGARPGLAKLWFANVLRDGFALTAAGRSEKFAVLAEEALRVLLAEVDLDRPRDRAVTHVLEGFDALTVHPDVVDGVKSLRAVGARLVTLTNGATNVAERLLSDAGIRGEFDLLLSVEDAPAWKPAATAYSYASACCSTTLEEMMLVAVQPWDVDGAARAGMRTTWLNRSGGPYPGYFRSPTFTARTLGDVTAFVSARKP